MWGSGKDVGGRARLSIEGLGPHCPPHFLGLLHSQAAVTPVTAAVTSLHHLCGLLDLLPWNVVLCERKRSVFILRKLRALWCLTE